MGRRAFAGLSCCCAAAALLACAACPAAARSSPSTGFAGVNYAFYSWLPPTDAARMAKGGVGSVVFGIEWWEIERAAGSYNWTATDATVGDLASNGIDSTPLLYGTPEWAADPSVTPAFNNVTAEPPTLTPQGTQGWIRFVQAAAARYGPGGSYWRGPYQQQHPGSVPLPIRVWQVWNEPNLPTYFQPHPSVRRYAQLLRVTRDALRTVQPRARIALGGLPCRVHVSYNCYRYLAHLYAQPGLKDDFDLVSLHPYAPAVRSVVDQIRRVKAVMRRHHDGRTKIWVSEVGWGSGSRDANYDIGKRGQARRLAATYRAVATRRRALGIWRFDWFDWRDPAQRQGSCIWCAHAGLFDDLDRPKPAWRAFRLAVGG